MRTELNIRLNWYMDHGIPLRTIGRICSLKPTQQQRRLNVFYAALCIALLYCYAMQWATTLYRLIERNLHYFLVIYTACVKYSIATYFTVLCLLYSLQADEECH